MTRNLFFVTLKTLDLYVKQLFLFVCCYLYPGDPVICVQNDFPFFVRKGSFSVQQGIRVDAQRPFSYTLPQKETERLRLSHNIGRAIVEIKERKTFDVALISISYTIFKPSF